MEFLENFRILDDNVLKNIIDGVKINLSGFRSFFYCFQVGIFYINIIGQWFGLKCFQYDLLLLLLGLKVQVV